MRESALTLQELARGDRLPLDVVNALIRFAKRPNVLRQGIHDGDLSAIADKNTNLPYRVQIHAATNIPAYSVFGVCLSGNNSEPVECIADMIGVANAGSLLGLFTNGQTVIAAGSKAIVESIGLYRPIKVQIAGEIPLVGEPCGVELNTFGVSSVMQGMVCLSGVFESNLIWVMRANDLSTIIGFVTQQANKFNSTNQTPGQGKLKIKFRDPFSNALVDSIAPGTGFANWELPFYNFSSEDITVGLNIRAESTLGIGLTVFETGAISVIEFILTGDFSGTNEANAEITASSNGANIGNIIIVHDDIGLFQDCIIGCTGFAVEFKNPNPETPDDPYYRVIACQRVVREATANVNQSMCGVNPAISSWTPIKMGAHTYDESLPVPAADKLFNAIVSGGAGHYAKNGDKIWLTRRNNLAPFEWHVREVQLHPQRVLFDIKYEDMKVKSHGTPCALEYCADPIWEDEIQLVNVGLVSDVSGSNCDITASVGGNAVVFDGGGGTAQTILNLQQVTLVVDVIADSNSLDKTTITAYVCGPSSGTVTTIIDIEDCP